MTTLVNFVALLDEKLIFLVFGVELFLLDLNANSLELRKGSLNGCSGSVNRDLYIILNLLVNGREGLGKLRQLKHRRPS